MKGLVRWLGSASELDMPSVSMYLGTLPPKRIATRIFCRVAIYLTTCYVPSLTAHDRHSCTPYASPPGRYASGTRYAAGCGRARSCHARHLRYAASCAAHSARPRAPAAASCGAKSVTR